MKAIRVAQYGEPQGLALQVRPDLVPGQGEVLINVAGSGVNPVDWKILSGAMKAFIPLELPYTPGGMNAFMAPDRIFQSGAMKAFIPPGV